MITIAIVNEKGGTAKTTTSVNLSAALGEQGHRVLLVDLDGQAASSRWLGVEEDTSFADALYSGKGLRPVENVIPNVSLAPASGKLDAVAHDLRPTQGGQLRKLLSEVSGRFDFTLIDCPPSLGNRLIGNALLAATHAVVPVETSILALDGLRILLTTLDDVRSGFGHEIVLAGVVACRFDPRTRLSRLVLGELQRALPGRVFTTVIRENIRMRECPASGQSILSYAPDSHAAEDYRSLAKELAASPWLMAQSQAAEPVAVDAFSGQESARIGEVLRQTQRRPGRNSGDEPAEWANQLESASQRLASSQEILSSGGELATGLTEAYELPVNQAPAAGGASQDGTAVAADTAQPAAETVIPIASVDDACAEVQVGVAMVEASNLASGTADSPQAEAAPGSAMDALPEVAGVHLEAVIEPAPQPADAPAARWEQKPLLAKREEASCDPAPWQNIVTGVAATAEENGQGGHAETSQENIAASAAQAPNSDNWNPIGETVAQADGKDDLLSPTDPAASPWRLDSKPSVESGPVECPNLRRALANLNIDGKGSKEVSSQGGSTKRGFLRKIFAGHKA